MKQINKWQAEDGSEWTTREKCAKRDAMIDDVDVAMCALKPHPSDSGWEGYVQHTPDTVMACKRRLFNIANQEGVLKWWIDKQKKDYGKTDKSLIEECHASWFCRMLDGTHMPLDRAYSRLHCIDEQLREWEQPYFAVNQGSGKNICVG